MKTRCCVLLLVALQVVAVLAGRAKRAPPQQCPEGFTRIGLEMCVSGRSLVKIQFNQQTWATTNDRCKADGARLVSLDTPEKLEALSKYLHSNSEFDGLYMWVGATRDATGWRWLNSAALSVESNMWLPNEPNPDETYNHATIVATDSFENQRRHYLRANTADSLAVGYVCEATGV